MRQLTQPKTPSPNSSLFTTMNFTSTPFDLSKFANQFPRFDTTKLNPQSLIDLVDSNAGVIFGSSVMGLVNAVKVNPKDIDIVFGNIKHAQRFVDRLVLASNGMMKSFERPQAYMFAVGMSCTKYEIKASDGSASIPTIEVHALKCLASEWCIQSTARSSIDNAQQFDRPRILSASPEKIAQHMLPCEFTKVLYTRKNIWAPLEFNLTTSFRYYWKIVGCEHPSGFCLKWKNRIDCESTTPDQSSRESTMTLDEAKANYQSKGLVVIPTIRRGKNCAGKGAAVSGWMFKTTAYDFNASKYNGIGIVCGPNSGIVCIDVDVKDKGMAYFDKMIKKYGFPKCPTQITPNGGRHYIFKYDNDRMKDMKPKIKGCSINGVPIGIDMWIQRCQFLVAPSRNHLINKEYKWIVPFESVAECPALPEWIYRLYKTHAIDESGTILDGTIPKATNEIGNIVEQMSTNEVSDMMRIIVTGVLLTYLRDHQFINSVVAIIGDISVSIFMCMIGYVIFQKLSTGEVTDTMRIIAAGVLLACLRDHQFINSVFAIIEDVSMCILMCMIGYVIVLGARK